MAITSVSHASSQIASAAKDMHTEQKGLRRSHSGEDLYLSFGVRRSYSDHNLCYSVNHICSSEARLKCSNSMGSFPFQLPSSILPPSSLRSFLFDTETSKVLGGIVKNWEWDGAHDKDKRANWVEQIMEISSYWRNRTHMENLGNDRAGDGEKDDHGCDVDYSSEEDDDGRVSFDCASFTRLLVPVPCSDAEVFSKLASLSSMAYFIPQIKAKDLRTYQGLRYITSSLEKKAEAAAAATKATMPASLAAFANRSSAISEMEKKHTLIPAAYNTAASAAPYAQLRTQNLLSSASELQQEGFSLNYPLREDGYPSGAYGLDMAASMTTSKMTAVVAAEEREKQEAAKNLRSLHSSPCGWFICDDLSTHTRCFVIQGSESLASWLANLFFKPTKFEGTQVLVHRGIYEAAKGMFEQLMPEVKDHLDQYRDRAKFRFTGHSLGGSLALLVSLMLLAREVIKPHAVLPIVTFGSPFVFCGGQRILDKLGLDQSHVHCVIMHNDIVPRALSCDYPDHIAHALKQLNDSFRSHPCLNKNKLLYSPMGEIFILQPDEKSSPPHPLLPPGRGFYALDTTQRGFPSSALRAFLNSPHPLKTLRDPTAYGSEGTILRDHDSSNYLRAMNAVLRQHPKKVVQAEVGKQTNMRLWINETMIGV